MKSIKCVIIEDEPLAQKILREHIELIDTVELVGTAFDAMEARELIERTKPDFLFLDINLPGRNGYDFLKSLPMPRPLVVVTSAHVEFALKGYELEVVDFLQKPIFFDPEFKRAIARIESRLRLEQQVIAGKESSDKVFGVDLETKLALIRSNYDLYRVPFDDILFIESMDNYVKIFRLSSPLKPLMPRTTLSSIGAMLPSTFIRIHRQYMINKQYIEKLTTGTLTLTTGKELPISRSFLEQVKLTMA